MSRYDAIVVGAGLEALSRHPSSFTPYPGGRVLLPGSDPRQNQ